MKTTSFADNRSRIDMKESFSSKNKVIRDGTTRVRTRESPGVELVFESK
jgi:hypothetical protein